MSFQAIPESDVSINFVWNRRIRTVSVIKFWQSLIHPYFQRLVRPWEVEMVCELKTGTF